VGASFARIISIMTTPLPEPRSTRSRSRLRLAAAAAVGVAALLVIALIAFSRFPGLYRGAEYRATFGDVAGLSDGDDVRYAGLKVGTVTSVGIDSADPSRIAVTFRVRRDTPVRTSTRATVPPVTLPPANFLALLPGAADAAPLPPGALVPSEEGVSLEESYVRFTRLLERTDTLLVAVGALVDGDFVARLDRTVARIDTLASAASRNADRVVPQLELAARRTNALLARTNRVLAALDSNRADLAVLPGEAVATLRETRTLLAEVRDGVGQGGGLEAVMRDLATAGDNLARLSSRLDRDPASVLKRRQLPPKTAGPPLRD